MRRLILLMSVVAALSGMAGWLLGHRAKRQADGDAHPAGATPPVPPPVPVGVAAVVRTTFDHTLLAYGQVGVAAEALQGVAAPFDGVVSRVTAVIGSEVHRGDLLLEIEASAELRQQLAEARQARTSAEQDLALVTQRRELSLATESDVALARHAFVAADQHFTLLSQRLSGDGRGPYQLRAPLDGMVVAVTAKPGTAALAGTALVDLAPGDRREVRLGIAAGEVAAIHVGQAISLQPLSSPVDAPVAGTVAWITSALDPATRLVDVVVALPAEAHVLDHEEMLARIPLSIADALVVPRSALVSDDNGTKVFVVSTGRAERTLVSVLAEDGTRAALRCADLAAGMMVVTDGASMLDDGQAVLAAPAPSPGRAPAPIPPAAGSAP